MARKADIEHALGTVETEAGTLSACDEECGDLSFTQQNFASLFPEIVTEIVCGEFPRHRREVGRNVVAQAGSRFFGMQRLEFLPILAQNIAFEVGAGFARQSFKMLGKLLLTRCIQSFDDIHVG